MNYLFNLSNEELLNSSLLIEYNPYDWQPNLVVHANLTSQVLDCTIQDIRVNHNIESKEVRVFLNSIYFHDKQHLQLFLNHHGVYSLTLQSRYLLEHNYEQALKEEKHFVPLQKRSTIVRFYTHPEIIESVEFSGIRVS